MIENNTTIINRSEKTQLDSVKQKSTPSPIVTTIGNAGEPLGPGNMPLKPIGGLSSLKNTTENTYCEGCHREFQEIEIASTKLILEQERLLSEIQKSKEELAAAMTELKKEENKRKPKQDEAEKSVNRIFNVDNMESLQELLEEAEANGQALLFLDGKGNTWQITARKDIVLDQDVGEGENEGKTAKAEEESESAEVVI